MGTPSVARERAVPEDELEIVLQQVRQEMDLDSETEHEVMLELRAHMQEALAEARASGLDEHAAVGLVLQRFGMSDKVGQELHSAHAGWGTADAVLAAALPVTCALALRWLAYAPDGTAIGWPELLNRPSFWVVATIMLLVPLLKFGRWRYAMAGWLVFWSLTVAFVAWPALNP
jgi:hypothetical protein